MQIGLRCFSFAKSLRATRNLVWAIGTLAAVAAALAQTVTVKNFLQTVRDEQSGEIRIAVTEDESDSAFQWYVDDQPLTPEPMKRASQLVFSASQALPGTQLYVVIVRPSGEVRFSETLSLVGLNSGTPASETSN